VAEQVAVEPGSAEGPGEHAGAEQARVTAPIDCFVIDGTARLERAVFEQLPQRAQKREHHADTRHPCECGGAAAGQEQRSEYREVRADTAEQDKLVAARDFALSAGL
jgi:hypothetical protein